MFSVIRVCSAILLGFMIMLTLLCLWILPPRSLADLPNKGNCHAVASKARNGAVMSVPDRNQYRQCFGFDPQP